MKRTLFLIVMAVLSLLGAAGAASGSGAGIPATSGSGFRAEVRDVAVIVTYSAATGETNFEFDVYNCPAGQIINIVWEAEQPRPSTSATGEATYVFSTGEPHQHLLLTAVSGFRPGYDWVGSGTVTCGALTTPVFGHGTTVPVGGGGSGDD